MSRVSERIKAEREEKRRSDQAEKRRNRGRNSAGLIPRGVGHLELKTRMLIVCEGTRTEPNYFHGFDLGPNIVIHGAGMNTLSLVERAEKLRLEAIEDRAPFDEVWVVFDKDGFKDEQFNSAVGKAQIGGISVAWSNEAFELWYLLHFEYNTSALTRFTYGERLAHYLGKPYKKNDPDVYELLRKKQPDAIRNAAKLRSEVPLRNANGPDTPANRCPATEVDKLVERLNALMR